VTPYCLLRRYLKPPWTNLDDFEEVPLEKSAASNKRVLSPPLMARLKIPAPEMPPPMMMRSQG